MNAPSHVAMGIGAWSLVASLLSWPLTAVGVGVAGLASLTPDIDHPQSTVGRAVPFLSWPIRLVFGHRGVTHSLFGWLAVAVALWWLLPPEYELLAWAALVGYASHLLGDYMTVSGVPLLWPRGQNYRSPLPFQTGGVVEFLVASAILMAIWSAVGGWEKVGDDLGQYLAPATRHEMHNFWRMLEGAWGVLFG